MAYEQIRNEVKQASIRARGESIPRRRSKSPTKPSAAWTAPSRIGSTKGTALSIVLSSIGCAHARGDEGGCTMCSYLLDGVNRNPTAEEFFLQFQTAMSQLEKLDSPLSVKIYTSGSFLDSDEIPQETRNRILQAISVDDRIKEVVLESRPEYVTGVVLTDVRRILGDRVVELGIGLESSSDFVRSICINKNFNLDSFRESLLVGKKHKIGTRAYVLLKPPFMTERSALLDAQKTVTDAISLGVTTISLNPVNVQRNTLVESLWEKGKYRPPWLWSVVEVLRHASFTGASTVNIVCDPVAAGKSRGTHNCGKCDSSFIDAIRTFSLNQDVRVFDSLKCDCWDLWKHVLEHEDASLHVHN
ncbi:MAG: archaeosine biosynthesis radical SAM protein RaSEA [Candidatus Odinarchaeota archaeon]